MKISKLFHWLYAILMLLPVVVFIPTAFYYGFNEHAVAQEKTDELPVYYDSNEVYTIDDLIIGNIYSWTDNLTSVQTDREYRLFNLTITDGQYENKNGIFVIASNGNVGLIVQLDNQTWVSVESYRFNFILDSYLIGFDNMPSVVLEHFAICGQKVIKEYQSFTTNMSISDSMSYAWDSVWQNDLFSWTYDSFLTRPFLYITNLFNVPPTNTLLYCLSYWLNISIIWLVFDLIMYVPLLAHRWIDKGIVE